MGGKKLRSRPRDVRVLLRYRKKNAPRQKEAENIVRRGGDGFFSWRKKKKKKKKKKEGTVNHAPGDRGKAQKRAERGPLGGTGFQRSREKSSTKVKRKPGQSELYRKFARKAKFEP